MPSAMVMDVDRLEQLASSGDADLIEVYSSIQGEGPHVGERHLFVRFVHCDIHCRYCDTPLCHVPRARARIERDPGCGEFTELDNPVPLEDLAALVTRALQAGPHHAVALTGGEPLLQPRAVRAVASAAGAAGVPALLETDGNLPEAFEEVQDVIAILSLDWKLPSATGEPARYEQHARFLELFRGREACVKLVFTSDTPDAEVLEGVRAASRAGPGVPLVLQPCTPCGAVRAAPPPSQVRRLHALALAEHAGVLVIPQVHRMLRQS